MGRSKNNFRGVKVGIYQLVANETSAKFMEKGYVRYGKKFDDDIVNLNFLDKNKYKFQIEENLVRFDDSIHFQFYRENVASTYFTKTARIPVFHCSVVYQKSVIVSNLFNVYLFFNVENAKSIKSFEELVNNNLKGHYELVIEFDDRQQTLPFEKFTSYEDLIESLLELFSTELLENVINEESTKRMMARMEKYGKVEDFKVPDKVTNFNDLIKKYQESEGNMDEVMGQFN